MTTTEASTKSEPTWFGHPRPLAVLFTTEMWERFGYYGMRALLILYLVNHFAFADKVAGGLYGAFTSLVYLTPLIGGFIADQYLGSKNSVKLGAILMSAGYLILAFSGGVPASPFVTVKGHAYQVDVVKSGESTTQYLVDGQNKYEIVGNQDGSVSFKGATGAIPSRVAKEDYKIDATRNPLNVMLLFGSLALIIVGNGYFKPNISTIVGTLYGEHDPRRDAGFTIFYMGINLGSIFSQGLAPVIAVWYGYSWGFAFAGFGMFLAWARIQFSEGTLAPFGNPPGGRARFVLLIIILSLAAVPVLWFLLNNSMIAASAEPATAGKGVLGYLASQPLLGQVMFVVYALALIGLPVWALLTSSVVERGRMFVAIVLTFFSTVFWTLFEQAGSSLTLFAERNTDRDIQFPVLGHYLMPAGQAQVFNPLFIVCLAPVFSVLWNYLGRRNLEPSSPVKFAIGLVFVGLGFFVLVEGSSFHDSAFKVPLFWLAFAYLLHSIGELCLSPVGLSAISKLSIPKLVGLMMGVWFLSSAMAQYIGGIVAQFASSETVGGKVLNAELSLQTYLHVFQIIGTAGIASGVLLFVLSPFLKRAMHGVQ